MHNMHKQFPNILLSKNQGKGNLVGKILHHLVENPTKRQESQFPRLPFKQWEKKTSNWEIIRNY